MYVAVVFLGGGEAGKVIVVVRGEGSEGVIDLQ